MSELMNIISKNISTKLEKVCKDCRILIKNQYHALLIHLGLQLGLTKEEISLINVDKIENAQSAKKCFWNGKDIPIRNTLINGPQLIRPALRNPTIDDKRLANMLDQEISSLKERSGKYDEVYE